MNTKKQIFPVLTMFGMIGFSMDGMTKYMKCGNCKYTFHAHRHDEIWCCPYCSAENYGNADVYEKYKARFHDGRKKRKN